VGARPQVGLLFLTLQALHDSPHSLLTNTDVFALGQAIYRWWSIPGLFLVLDLVGLTCFGYIVAKRLTPLLRAQRDPRFDRLFSRLQLVLTFWLAQWRHPRYPVSALIHIPVFAGFLLLFLRAISLLILGVSDTFVMPGFSGSAGRIYNLITDYAATIVFVAVIVAAVRRGVFKPARYAVPARFGKDRSADAIFLLLLIALLMAADSTFAAARSLQPHGEGAEPLASLSLPWMLQVALGPASESTTGQVRFAASLVHEVAFFFLLCYRPFGVQFHVETSLFSVWFAKLNRGALKPVRWGVADGQLDQLKSFGVKRFEDFTWKHVLDFYSCADCGRCSDQCPANAAGRPLSPRFLTIKGRDYAFDHYPVFGAAHPGVPLIGNVYSEDEVWSCTTCGACEAECPLLVEYIDKIVDLRRGLVDDGRVPQSLQKALRAVESRGNPFGKVDKKRADWTKAADFQPNCRVKVLDRATHADLLLFVDSITSYDDRIQSIARATARVLDSAGEDFGVLGAAERDSGHDVRRFGEETLFMALREHNAAAIKASGVRRIVTADPHAFNALRHDYPDVPPVEHITQLLARHVKAGSLAFAPAQNGEVYTFHDPCYLGRHNQVYDAPRDVLDAIPDLKRIEMRRCRDRSFCCGGGGLALFYEPKEEQRMGVLRVRMAAEAGANVIVTACPFCMVNIEDAIKVAGLDGQMSAIDVVELADRHLPAPPTSPAPEPAFAAALRS
jgi:Fe-S oxidoreductase